MATNQNSRITVTGLVASGAEFSHDMFGEKFYEFKIAVPRDSGSVDILPVQMSECLFDVDNITIDTMLKVKGQVRTMNKRNGEKSKLVLTIFAEDVNYVPFGENTGINNVVLDGYICKETVYRETPFGREICDLLLAVNRAYGKSSYIPCVIWGRTAKFADTLNVGQHIKVTGRLQSREYNKVLEDGSSETKTAYELSVFMLEVLEGAE